MDDWNNIGAFQDYSAFFPDETFDLFGDYQLGSEIASLPFPAFPEVEIGGHFTSLSAAADNAQCILDQLNTSPSDSSLSILPNASTVGPECTDSSPKMSTTEGLSSVQALDVHPRTSDGFNVGEASQSVKQGSQAPWRDSLIVFSATTGAKFFTKQRRSFEPRRRQEVAMNRIVGACIQCKLRKGSCNVSIPCNTCIKRAGSAALAKEICTRQSLVATRFDYIDLFKTHFTQSRLSELEIPLSATHTHFAYLHLHGIQERIPNLIDPEFYIKVPICEIDHPDIPSFLSVFGISYYGWSEYRVPNSRDAIPWESLPTVEDLMLHSQMLGGARYGYSSPFIQLRRAVDDFAALYCNSPIKLPLQGLLDKTLQLQCLLGIFQTMPRIKSLPNNAESRYVSSTVSAQIDLIVSRRIIELEVEVLSKIDKLAQGVERTEREDPLAVWMCLWLLILTYQEHMIYEKAFLYHDPQKYYLMRHIYNTLTTIYSALYRTTSPLMLDWRKEEVSRLLGNDPFLIYHFCNIQTELFWFQTQNVLSEDSAFKKMVIENESRHLDSRRKAAKKQGLL